MYGLETSAERPLLYSGITQYLLGALVLKFETSC